MGPRELVTLKRDTEAVEIPIGTRTVLPAGSTVTITQALGDHFTVITEMGYLVQIAGKDADAIGKEPPPQPSAGSGSAEDVEKAVWEQLRTVYDPEIPVNIVDLGLVYVCQLGDRPEGGKKVDIKMTMTAPGCGMGDYLKVDIHAKLLGIPGVKEADIEVVFEPPWDQSRMSEAAKLQLGLM